MCSINGFSFKDEFLINQFINKSKHRGPDSSKINIIDNFSFGFNLLPIDSTVETGLQPLISEKYVFMHNGEIYNKEFLSKKYDISSFNSDSDLVFKIINSGNIEIFDELEGIFAISLFDRYQEKIYLCRDIFGSKPLYYTLENNNLFFSSYLKNLIDINKNKIINKNSLETYLNYGYNSLDATLLKNINHVPQNKILEFSLKTRKINFIEKEFREYSVNTNANNFKNSLVSSFKINEKNQGLLLSGGIDSNIILSELINEKHKPIVFSTFFENSNNSYNEDFFTASNISKQHSLEFNPIFITKKNFIHNLQATYEILDQPILNINSPVYYQTFSIIKKFGVKTVLCGDGGDELFFGYNWQKVIHNLSKLNFFRNNYNFSKTKLLKIFIYLLMGKFEKIYHENEKLNFYSSLSHNLLTEKFNFYKKHNLDYLISSIFFKLTNDFLMLKDNLGMHFSIETRYPLLQKNFLFNYVKSNNYQNFNKKINKPLLFKYYGGNLGFNKFLINNKKGWSVPREWLIDNKLISLQKDLIKKSNLRTFLSEFNLDIDMNKIEKNIKYRSLLFSLASWLKGRNLI